MTNTMTTPRPYRMRKRLEDVEETRQRIVEAAVELHGSVGPANTTYSSIAELAGVQRSTVYRHFPDDETLFGACTSHWFARHPWPSTESWRRESDPSRRIGLALRELYRYYADNDLMLSNAQRDVAIMPVFVGQALAAQLEHYAAVLLEAWPDPASRTRQLAVRHALDLRTWHSLAEAGASPQEAAELMAQLVACEG